MHPDDLLLRAMVAFRQGKSVALIGSAGSGKSFVMKDMLSFARIKYDDEPNAVVPCAFTNTAAREICGDAIRSIFHILSSWNFTKHSLLDRVSANREVCNRIREMKVLVVDELKILRGPDLDSIEYVVRILTSSQLASGFPFGGIQVLFAFDPFQLEAIKIDAAPTACEGGTWKSIFGGDGDGIVTVLTAEHRQHGDKYFFHYLSRIRLGEREPSDIHFLNKTSNGLPRAPTDFVRLGLKNSEVQGINNRRLDFLKSKLVICKVRDKFPGILSTSVQQKIRKQLKQMDPAFVSLKQGAAVMPTRRFHDLLPGTRCVVMEIHQASQRGQSNIDVVVRDAGFAYSETASGSCRTLTLPVQLHRIEPVEFHLHNDDGSIRATRLQIPVAPAYAMTIHKSQGLTFNKVAIDFSKVLVTDSFKPFGFVYVALSRCRTMKGLWVKGLRLDHIRVSNRPRSLMKYISRIAAVRRDRIINVRNISTSLPGPSTTSSTI